GWEMPLHYGSQIREHHQVRRSAGMFDVSHMTVVDLSGDQVRNFLRVLLANGVNRLAQPGQALYSCMLNRSGGVIDDLIVYFLEERHFRMVVNAATREKDLAWIENQAAGFGVDVTERDDLAMIAVQGPDGREAVHGLLDSGFAAQVGGIKRFTATWRDQVFVARTGYTGEDGYELIIPADEATRIWTALLEAGVLPAGLGARDTLRLEAGMNLYGTDMDEETTPLESGLDWTVAWEPIDRRFIGRESLEEQRREGPVNALVGLMLEGRGVLRNHQAVYGDAGGTGEITSGGFSPTMGRSIALARIPVGFGAEVEVEIRGKRAKARVVKPPFVRNGRPCIQI
ncbi:MAG: glycine cleavage system aminomethyltransferase GcvT, partial [Gammaproteobacteria bacterium]|nr:glycine cleavage system aminomethyltransferase GcvT [Gammaproteobacteria bacterium]